MPSVVEDEDPVKRRVLLKPEITSLDTLQQDVQDLIREHAEEVVRHDIRIGADHMSTEEILKMVLPAEVGTVSSFETVGHIAHVNLRDEQLPHKYVIGDVILSKNTHLKTVVNKVGRISSTFRVFDMEVIAGEDDLVTEVKEHGCRFKLDFRQVYWNSRLQTEHTRIVSLLQPNDVVCDMFCGIGPFAIPAAKAGANIYANDLNPVSIEYLNENRRINKVEGHVESFNEDARDFVKRIITSCQQGERHFPKHYVMNLPASAPEFLDVFHGLLTAKEISTSRPRVHCYCFHPSTEGLKQRLQNHLGSPLQNVHIHNVRLVAPGKHMYCVSFDISATSAALPKRNMADEEDQGAKRPKPGD